MNSTSAKFIPLFATIFLIDIFAGIEVNSLLRGVFIALMGAVLGVCVFEMKGLASTVSRLIAGIILGTFASYMMRDFTGWWVVAREILTALFGLFAPETVMVLKGSYKEALKKRIKKFTDEL